MKQNIRFDIINKANAPLVREDTSNRESVGIFKKSNQALRAIEKVQTEHLEIDSPAPSTITPDEWVTNTSDTKIKKWMIEHPTPKPLNHLPASERSISEVVRPNKIPPTMKNFPGKMSHGFTLLPHPRPGKPQLDFIPSDIELETLCTVWQQDSISGPQIYAALDTNVHVTAEGLDQALKRLTEKGLLTRKIISPQQKFKFFFLPEDRFGLELSPKNRRNRVYQYSANIASEEMLNFLNAAASNANQSCQMEGNSQSDSAKTIQNKIIKMLHELPK